MRELRNKDPNIYRLITIRTVESRLWLGTSSKSRKLLGGIVARYQEIFGIEIYAYAFLGNHYHMIIRSPRENTDEFLENVNREISRRFNWVNKREGPLWGRRYVDQEILSKEDLLEAFLYVNTNPVRHGLISTPFNWGSLHSAEHVLNETDRKFSFRHYSEEGTPVTVHKLKITPLPEFKELSQKERKAKILTLIKERVDSISKERDGKFLPLNILYSEEIGSKPILTKRTPKAPFYSKFIELIRAKRKELRALRDIYDEASSKYRLGERDVTFPPFCFFPPKHRLPRIIPFTPISSLA